MNTTSVRTSDIVLAASLVFLNHKLDEVQVNTMGQGTFIFSGVHEKTLLAYQTGGLNVEPKAFNQTVVHLSRMCRQKSR